MRRLCFFNKLILRRLWRYLKESYDELVHKTSWPTMQELGNSVVVVSIASLIIALIVFLMDTIFNLGMNVMFPPAV